MPPYYKNEIFWEIIKPCSSVHHEVLLKVYYLPMTKSNRDLKFMLRVFSEMPINLTSMDQPTKTESWDEFWDNSDF